MATERISVIGAGSWGTALAVHLARKGLEVCLWGHLPDHVAALRQDRENREFLPGIPLEAAIHPESSLDVCLDWSPHLLVVTPSHAFADVVDYLAKRASAQTAISWASKGFLPGGHGQLLHEAVLTRWPNERCAIISGPTFAGEVARGLPTAVTVASPHGDYARELAALIHSPQLRAYSSADLIGVQVGGAAKNVIAIAAGIADGLGFGANTRAALITRGLAEIMRLGCVLGGKPETFMGLSGLGDLALTCTDNQSRNRRLGLALGQGQSLAEARKIIAQEIEGINTAREIAETAQRLGIDMPISEQVYRVLHQGIAPREAAQTLLERTMKAEH